VRGRQAPILLRAVEDDEPERVSDVHSSEVAGVGFGGWEVAVLERAEELPR